MKRYSLTSLAMLLPVQWTAATIAADHPPLAIAPFDAKQAKEFQQQWVEYTGKELIYTNSIGMKMVLLPPGEFMMGIKDAAALNELRENMLSSDGHWDRVLGKGIGPVINLPGHRVRLNQPICMGSHEVTVGQFRQFTQQSGYKTDAERGLVYEKTYEGEQPIRTWQKTFYKHADDHPVLQVGWKDCMAFCEWLSKQEAKQGHEYSLPTDAEWEYACRAGTTTMWHFGDPDVYKQVAQQYANMSWKSGTRPIAVGQKKPNALGLFDMHGNAWEWCQDWWDKALRHLPLSTWDEVIGYEVPYLRDWIAHPHFDSYWEKTSIRDRWNEITCPSVTISGWYDVFLKQATEHVGAVRAQSTSEHARRHQYLIIGPWAHNVGVSKVGDLDFGPQARMNIAELADEWHDYWLEGQPAGIDKWAPVHVFVMGRNQWRNEQEWPLKRTQFTPYYFHSSGSANTLDGNGELSTKKPGQEPTDTYVYDPDNPVPTLGGNNYHPLITGPRDQRQAEQRDDVLVFTSKPLEDEVEVTGPVKVILFAASTAPDTDWTAKLVNVHPDGRAINLCDGIIRARYRESRTEPTLIEPEKVYRYEIDLWATSNVFLAGHRIRVEISSSDFPRFDRNPNTGHPFGADAQLKQATQTVYHDGERPSHILLPIIPK